MKNLTKVCLFTLILSISLIKTSLAQIGNPETTHLYQIPKGSVFTVKDTIVINANENSAALVGFYSATGVSAQSVTGTFVPQEKTDFNRTVLPDKQFVVDSVKQSNGITFYFHDGSHLNMTSKAFDIAAIVVKRFNDNCRLFKIKVIKVETKKY